MSAKTHPVTATRLVTCPHCGRRNRVPAAAGGIPRCGNCHRPLPWIVDADDDSFAGMTGTKVLLSRWQFGITITYHFLFVPLTGASHLFEEPGAVEQVARPARGWFSQHLRPVLQADRH